MRGRAVAGRDVGGAGAQWHWDEDTARVRLAEAVGQMQGLDGGGQAALSATQLRELIEKMLDAQRVQQAADLYEEHEGTPLFASMCEAMTTGPLIAPDPKLAGGPQPHYSLPRYK